MLRKLIALQNENETLRAENRALQERLALKESTVSIHDVYWTTNSVRNERESETRGEEVYETRYAGPFCPMCKDLHDKMIRLRWNGQTAAQGKHRVYVCEVHHGEYEAPPLNER